MSPSREPANLKWWVTSKYGWLAPLYNKHVKWNWRLFIKPFKSPYFWHDNIGKYWNRTLGCKRKGHKIEMVDNLPYCFACERHIMKEKGINET